MITIVLNTTPVDKNSFEEYFKIFQKEFTTCVFFTYNRIADRIKSGESIAEIVIRNEVKETISPNSISHLDTWWIQSSYYSAKELIKARAELEFDETDEKLKGKSQEEIQRLKDEFEKHRYSCVFGGRKNFIRYQQGLITKEEFVEKRLRNIYSVGEAPKKGNRKFSIQENCSQILFKADRTHHFLLNINVPDNLKQIINLCYKAQESCSTAITYRLSKDKIWISVDESVIYKDIVNYTGHTNRILSLDLNPNYIGYSITEWFGENEYIIYEYGVYSLKEINDKWIKTKDDVQQRSYLNNKLNEELMLISKNLINKAVYYNCEICSVEKLSIKSSDKKKGKLFNTLCNNLFHKNRFKENLQKRCNIQKIKFIEVKAEYSSFVGNLIYRGVDAPDMCLAAIEIGRRAYEYNNQYLTKTKDTKKNIVYPDIQLFMKQLTQSLEELSVDMKTLDWKKLYDFIKNSKLAYRVPVSKYSGRFQTFESKESKVKHFHVCFKFLTFS